MLKTLIFAAAIIWGVSLAVILLLFAEDQYSRRTPNQSNGQ
jgi:hypothetical protein